MLGFKRIAPSASSERTEDLKLIKDDAFSLYESTVRNMRSVSKAEGGGKCLESEATCCSCARQGMALSSTSRTFSISSFSGKIVSVDLAASNTPTSGAVPSNPTCFHCRRKACSMCCRQCARCDEDFCSVCSILDFQERYDRAFCLECYTVVQSTSR